jgi:hypothetical protein
MPSKKCRRLNTHFTHQQDRRGIGVGRRSGRIGVIRQCRHHNGICGRIFRLYRGWWSAGLFFLRWLRMAKQADFARGRRSPRRVQAGALKIAGARGGIAAQRFNLSARKYCRAALRKNQSLIGELRLHSHGSARGHRAHFAAFLKADRKIAPGSRDRDGRGYDRRRENREDFSGIQCRMNTAVIERQRDGPGRLEHLEMRRPAYADRAS